MRKDYDIVGSYNNQRVTNIDSERTINLFEYIDVQGKKPKSLLPTSGLRDSNVTFSSATLGFRAQFVFGGNSYHVIGGRVYLVNSSLVSSLIGTLTTSTGYVGIDANTFQVIFVDGQKGYIYNVNVGTFTLITDTSFPAKPIDVCYLDGFFVVASGDTNNFQLSLFNNGLVWGPAQDTFTASKSTSLLTVPSTLNYQTGVPVTLSVTGTNTHTFTASAATDIITIASGTDEYAPSGRAITVAPGSGGTLPAPLAVSTTYYTIILSPTTLQLATTLANATAPVPVPIDLTTDGTPPNNIITPSAIPAPLVVGVTYYTIFVSATTIRLATTSDNAYAGTFITLTTDGSGTETIRSAGQLQQASMTSHPGTIVSCRTLHRRLFLFSQNFTEVWENAGIGTNLPFRRNNALLMEYGCPAIGSISVGFDKMFFLSQDKDGLGSVMQVSGTESVPISNRALDFQLAQYVSNTSIGVADARGILIKENGLIFYRLNFTKANHTYVYNLSMSSPQNPIWHEEEILNGNRHPAQTHAYFNGVNYYGDYQSPKMYVVDNSISTNNGEIIRRARIGRPVVPAEYNRTRIDRFHLDLLQGDTDLITDNGNIEPYVFLSISRDGGQSYGTQIIAPMGKIGERSFRTVWRKLGTIPRGQAFVPMIQFWHPIPFVILGASWDFEIMPE